MNRTRSQNSPRDKILDAAARLIAEKGWHQTSEEDIVSEAGVTPAEFYELFSGKYAIPPALSQRMTGRMLSAGEDWEAEDTTKDRLFDLFMARFDADADVRRCFQRLMRAAPTDPALATVLAGTAYVAMQRLLEAAGITASGPLGSLRAQTLAAAVYAPTLRDWFSDDTADLGKTMAALNGRLDRLDGWVRRLQSVTPGRRGRKRSRIKSAMPPLNDLISEPLEDRPSRKVAGQDRDVAATAKSGQARAKSGSKSARKGTGESSGKGGSASRTKMRGGKGQSGRKKSSSRGPAKGTDS